jgi:hypothetical protein
VLVKESPGTWRSSRSVLRTIANSAGRIEHQAGDLAPVTVAAVEVEHPGEPALAAATEVGELASAIPRRPAAAARAFG